MDNLLPKFNNAEAYLRHLLKIGRLSPEKVIFPKDKKEFITVNAGLTVDSSEFSSDNIDFSRILANKVIFNKGRIIRDYARLPSAKRGISGDIPAPSGVNEFLQKNAFSRFTELNGICLIDGDLNIPDFKNNRNIDLSMIQAGGKIVMHNKTPIKLSALPSSNIGIIIHDTRQIENDSGQPLTPDLLKKYNITASTRCLDRNKSSLSEKLNSVFCRLKNALSF